MMGIAHNAHKRVVGYTILQTAVPEMSERLHAFDRLFHYQRGEIAFTGQRPFEQLW